MMYVSLGVWKDLVLTHVTVPHVRRIELLRFGIHVRFRHFLFPPFCFVSNLQRYLCSGFYHDGTLTDLSCSIASNSSSVLRSEQSMPSAAML